MESFEPAPRLASLVASYLAIDAATDQPFDPRRVPDGGLDLVFDLDPVRPRAFVQGAIEGPRGLREDGVSGTSSLLVVQLKPGAVPAWFGPPASDFVDGRVPAEDAFGPAFRGLAEGLASSASNRARVARVESAIADPREALDPRIRLAVEALGTGDVPGAARAAGVSPRTLRSLFERWIGAAPKTLSRIFRFQRAAAALCDGTERWAGVAADAGYADQAHMTREIRALSGLTPTGLVASAGRIHRG